MPSVGSTNDALRDLTGAGERSVLIAERQLAGRGRRGRSWHSPPGLGIYLSVLLRPAAADPLTRWTLAASIAACEATRAWCGVELTIEWPNDLMHRARKLGGILAEARGAGSGSAELILGTGLNVAHGPTDFPPSLRSIAGSLRQAAGQGMLTVTGREAWVAEYVGRLFAIDDRLRAGAWQPLAERWEALAPGCRGRAVRVLGRGGHETFRGVTAGLAEDGALNVRRPDGRVVAVRMVESVRPLA